MPEQEHNLNISTDYYSQTKRQRFRYIRPIYSRYSRAEQYYH